MCSIIGFINHKNSIEKTLFSLDKISYRGSDSFGIYTNNQIFIEKNLNDLKSSTSHLQSPLPITSSSSHTESITLGHSLLSLVNFVEQPLKNQGIFISNCEIYNWQELNKKYNLNAKNDSDLLHKLIEFKKIENLKETLKEIDGVYAFAYFDEKKQKLILTRDILGVKPLFYSYSTQEKSFAFASEKKALLTSIPSPISNPNSHSLFELDPKTILEYDLKNKKIKFENKDFYSITCELEGTYSKIKKETKKLLINAVKKRIPESKHKIGVLFSGGIDSTFICYVLKELNIDFTCYTAKVEGGNIKEAEDLIYAKEIAKKYGYKLDITKITTDKLEEETKEVIKIIEDNEYIKTSVALPFYLACKKAKQDNIKVIFSGLGSEEIFAGYRRHKQAEDPNQECVNGLSILHIRDLYRDDTITMSQTMELRLPFLDKKLIEYSLNIPLKYKLNIKENRSKIILREIAKEMGLDEKYSERQKKAAQYGSKFDKGLLRLAKNKGVNKQEYLNSLI